MSLDRLNRLKKIRRRCGVATLFFLPSFWVVFCGAFSLLPKDYLDLVVFLGCGTSLSLLGYVDMDTQIKRLETKCPCVCGG